jgi:energy-coupling factor transporter ATP-binding protein EcfA2
MELSGRPLLATRVDDAFYVERSLEAKALAAARRGLNVLLLGDAGSGKTSLLHHLEYELQHAEEQVVYLDGRRSVGLDDLLDELRRRVGVTRPTTQRAFDVFATIGMFSGQEPVTPSPAAERTLDALRSSMPANKRWIVLVDSPDRDMAHTLFGRLRDLVWQLPISWIVAADSASADAFRRPPADAFFDLLERIGTLEDSTAREMLVRRGVATSTAEELLAPGTTTPRALMDRARRSMLEPVTPDELHRGELEFQRRLGEVSRAAAMLATEMRDKGALSASDEDLQRRMGWTRPRLTQVLKELEAKGLARATEAAGGRAGRPRRLYDIVEP